MSLRIRAAVARATRTVVPLWPLSSFIAVNPLGALEHDDFDLTAPTRPRESFLHDYALAQITDRDLIATMLDRAPELASAGETRIGGRVWSAGELLANELVRAGTSFVTPAPQQEDQVDQLMAKWMAAYLDPHPLWAMPNRDRGLWHAWRAMAPYDPQLPMAARRRLKTLPDKADEGLETTLAHWGVEGAAIDDAIREEAKRSPGWTAHVKWRADHKADVDLTSYLAMRLTLRWALDLPAPKPAVETTVAGDSVWDRADRLISTLTDEPVSSDDRARVARILVLHPQESHAATWQSAYELHYRRQLLESLCAAVSRPRHPSVIVVMCIDPRSEGMRRHLEKNPGIETYGFAGFFGVPIRFASFEARGSIDALPALLAARHSVTETTAHTRQAALRRKALRGRDAVSAALHVSENAPAAPFALAETLGWFSGAATLLRTVWPTTTARAAERLRRLTTPTLDTEITIADAFSLDERAALAENSIRMMGLENLPDLVVLTGHGSTSANNLYQSALDCGACGGNPGHANARAAAAIFNDPDVRRILEGRGLPIPASTFFVAAEHNTVSDRIEILDRHLIPASHAAALDGFVKTQDAAADDLLIERAAQLPGAHRDGVARLRRRAHDWAEVYPELGLAGNAAMIIGPREMSRGVDLERRVFLHSYQTELDPDGSALETIMTAPMVVAQWINHQYYFSTVDNERWGAGTKTVHNAIGTIGVISGHSGDLKRGLPLQSVAVGNTLLHEARRLSVVIQAPLDRIGAIISRNQVLRHLFDNNWITLTARADDQHPWFRYGTYGWTTLAATEQTKQTALTEQGD